MKFRFKKKQTETQLEQRCKKMVLTEYNDWIKLNRINGTE